jgi:hypothetical protein
MDNSMKMKCILISVGLVAAFSLRANAQTPKLVYSDSLASPGEPGNGFRIQYGGAMGNGSLAGNLVTLRITAPHGSTISSIADNKSDSYTLGVSEDSGSGGWVTALYYLPNAPAGITQITVTYSASVADWHGAIEEYSGIATSSPADGTCGNTSSTVACSAAITTTGNNDLVVASMIGLGSSIYTNTMGTIAAGGSFSLDSADTQASDGDEEEVLAMAGSVTPSFTITGSTESFNIVGMAFKASAGAGTNPTGMYILHEQHFEMVQTSETINFPSNGNLLVADTDIFNGEDTIAINSCSSSNTWTKENPSGGDMPQFFFVSSAIASTTLTCTVQAPNPEDHGILVFYDVVGAAASPFDTLGPGNGSNGSVVTNTVTPTKPPGIAFAVENTGVGPGTGIGTGFTWDNTPYTGETDAGQLNNGDGWQHYWYTSASQITFTWDQANSSSYMQAAAITFSSNPVSAPAPPTSLTATPH